MGGTLKKWQHSVIRNGIVKYRDNLENYYIKNKATIEVDQGQAFSLLSPPLGSPAARRRIRFIMNNMIINDPETGENKSGEWISKTPHFMTMAITYKCQCDCLHCSSHIYKEEVDHNKSALSLEEMKIAIKQSIDLGTTCVILTGGEPLLHKKIYELINAVDKNKSICTIFTNGEYLTESVVQKLKEAGIFGVFVSLDHPDPKEHNQHRKRKDLFEKAVQGIKLCQKKGIVTGISTFTTKEKMLNGELDIMMNLGKKLDVLEVFVFDIIATGKLENEPSCMLNANDINALKEFRKKYNLKPEYPRIIHQTMFTSIAYPCAAEGCPGGVAQIHIRGNGDVCPCDFTPLSFGNIRQRPLSEIWQSIRESDIYSKPSSGCRLADPKYRSKLMKPSIII